jgi:hypothetical protein
MMPNLHGSPRPAAARPWRYIYLGDRLTDDALRRAPCDPVRRADGRTVVGAGKQLVVFAGGRRAVVLRRRLRLAVRFPA